MNTRWIKKYTLVFAIILCVLQILSANQKYTTQRKASEITIQALEMSHDPLDSTAVASYLFQKVEIEYDLVNEFSMIQNYHFRIKIYNDEGVDWGDFKIPLYKESNGTKMKLIKLKGASYNLIDDRIEETKLSKKDVYEEQVSDKWIEKRFAMPKVKPGTIIDITYSIRSPYVYTVPEWYFQHPIPTHKSIFQIYIPEYFRFAPIASGVLVLDRESIERTNRGYNEGGLILTATDVPPIKDDEFVLNINDYRSGVKYELQSFQAPNKPIQYFSKSWDKIARNLMENQYLGKQLNKKLKPLSSYVSKAKPMAFNEKLSFLAASIKELVTWNKKMSIYTDEGIKKAIEKKLGNSADLSLILTNMYREVGLDAYPILIRNRSRGILNTAYPSLSELGHIIVGVEHEGSLYLIDPSCKFCPAGILPTRSQNYFGLRIKENDDNPLISIPNQNSYNSSTHAQYEVDVTNSSLVGNSRVKRSNYAALKFRIDAEKEATKEDDTEQEVSNDQENYLENINTENIYEVIKTKGINDITSDIQLFYNEKLFDKVSGIGDKLFIDAMLDFGMTEQPFTDTIRDYPVFYNSKVSIVQRVNIKIPEGYQVESLPQNTKQILPNALGGFQYIISVNGQYISIYYAFEIKQDVIPPEDYPYLRTMYTEILKLSDEKIILSK